MFLATNMCLCVDWENTWKEAMFFACRMSAMFYLSKLNSLHADNECRWQPKKFRIKCCIIIWIQHEKCIKMSSNKPCMGAEFLEIAPRILWKKLLNFQNLHSHWVIVWRRQWWHPGGMGAFAPPPHQRLFPLLDPHQKKKNGQNQAFWQILGFLPSQKCNFPPQYPPQKKKKKFWCQEGLLKWQPVGNPAQRPFLFGPCQLQYTC